MGAAEVDKYAVAYLDSRANVNLFEPAGSAGQALGHSHGLIGVPLQNSLTATYGNSNGIGDKLGSTGGQQYQYMMEERKQAPGMYIMIPLLKYLLRLIMKTI